MEVLTESAEETKEFGKKFAADLITKKAVVLALKGDLGSGKTTFVQGLAEGLGVEQRTISPTFILMRKYELPVQGERQTMKDFYHVDLYRLDKYVEREVINLGVEELWQNPENIIAIEWAEKIKNALPKDATWIEFENLGADKRKLTIRNKL